jgi:hypothetical protein
MDPYGILAISSTRHDDLVREAHDSRVAKIAKDTHDESRPAPKPVRRPAQARRLGLAR